MPRSMTTRLAASVLSAVFCIGIAAAPAANAAPPKPRVFTNCAQLNGVYPHGVGKTGAHDKGTSKGFRPVTTFKVNTAVYLANAKKLDRDKDGIACEKR